jgi:hypothetical protein
LAEDFSRSVAVLSSKDEDDDSRELIKMGAGGLRMQWTNG